jgi:hypothetical protein
LAELSDETFEALNILCIDVINSGTSQAL